MWRRAWIGKAVGTAQSGVRYGGGPPDDREGKAKQARRERVSESMPGSRDIPASQARMRLCRPCNEVHPYTSTRNKSGISQRNGTTTPTCRVLAAASAPLHCSPWIPELCWLGSRVRSWQRSKQASGSSETAKPALPPDPPRPVAPLLCPTTPTRTFLSGISRFGDDTRANPLR